LPIFTLHQPNLAGEPDAWKPYCPTILGHAVIGWIYNTANSHLTLTYSLSSRNASFTVQRQAMQVCADQIDKMGVFKTNLLTGASLSEPHIDEFAVNFLYIYLSYVMP